jgi:hypothetical protein
VLEDDALLWTGSGLAQNRTTAPRRGGERRVEFAAVLPAGRQVHVIDQPCVEQLPGQDSSADAGDPLPGISVGDVRAAFLSMIFVQMS